MDCQQVPHIFAPAPIQIAAETQTGGEPEKTAYVRVTCPTAKLTVNIAVYTVGTINGTLSADNAWTLTPLIEHTNGEIALEPVFEDRAYPDAYEASSSVKTWRATIVCDGFAQGTGLDWYVKVTWEPNVPMSPEERQFWFSQCRVDREGGILNLDNGS